MSARSQGLYKTKDLMPSDNKLDQLTTRAAELVILQRMKQKLDRLDTDPESPEPAAAAAGCNSRQASKSALHHLFLGTVGRREVGGERRSEANFLSSNAPLHNSESPPRVTEEQTPRPEPFCHRLWGLGLGDAEQGIAILLQRI